MQAGSPVGRDRARARVQRPSGTTYSRGAELEGPSEHCTLFNRGVRGRGRVRASCRARAAERVYSARWGLPFNSRAMHIACVCVSLRAQESAPRGALI